MELLGSHEKKIDPDLRSFFGVQILHTCQNCPHGFIEYTPIKEALMTRFLSNNQSAHIHLLALNITLGKIKQLPRQPHFDWDQQMWNSRYRHAE